MLYRYDDASNACMRRTSLMDSPAEKKRRLECDESEDSSLLRIEVLVRTAQGTDAVTVDARARVLDAIHGGERTEAETTFGGHPVDEGDTFLELGVKDGATICVVEKPSPGRRACWVQAPGVGAWIWTECLDAESSVHDAVYARFSRKHTLIVDEVSYDGRVVGEWDTFQELGIADHDKLHVTYKADDHCYCPECDFDMGAASTRQLCGKYECDGLGRC